MGCVRASGAPDGSRFAVTNDSGGVFMNSKLRASTTKSRKSNILLHLIYPPEVSTAATSPMKKTVSTFCLTGFLVDLLNE